MRVNKQGLRILMPVIKEERRDSPGLCLQRMGLGIADLILAPVLLITTTAAFLSARFSFAWV
jgi:hypothetical protein